MSGYVDSVAHQTSPLLCSAETKGGTSFNAKILLRMLEFKVRWKRKEGIVLALEFYMQTVWNL